jgi:hypothetical protein
MPGMPCKETIQKPRGVRKSRARGTRSLPILMAFGFVFLGTLVRAQQPDQEWQTQVRKNAERHLWDSALRIIDREIALHPDDLDIHAWRARVLTWAARLPEAEQEFNEILKRNDRDPDNWMGLAAVYLRRGLTKRALESADHAVDLDPGRADLRARRDEILANADSNDARVESPTVLPLGPTGSGVLSDLSSPHGKPKEELRFGFSQDNFSFASANRNQWVTLLSNWTPRWTTSATGSLYERDGINATNFIGSITRNQPLWGSLTVGGGSGHDNGVIPRTEAFFDFDHGFKISEDRPIRGIEVIYGQHWYWYASARILTASETAIVYLPRDWTWSIGVTDAHGGFSGTKVDWKPSGQTRLGVPLGHWSERELTGNVFFAVGTEDFAQADQIDSFASQIYGGGLRFRFTAHQDVTAYGAFQQRTQDRAQTNFGFSYGIRF